MQKTRLPNVHTSPDLWLLDLIEQLRPVYASIGLTIPDKIRGTIAFTSRGRPPRDDRKGPGVWPAETWPASASADGFVQIFIRADFDQPQEIAAILAHELLHAALGGVKHGKEFRDAALRLGMEGKMSHALPGQGLSARLNKLLEGVGPLPRARLNYDQVTLSGLAVEALKKKQTTRMLKAECLAPGCGYTARVAARWISDCGPPHCPLHGAMTTPPVSAATPAEDDEAEAIPSSKLDAAE